MNEWFKPTCIVYLLWPTLTFGSMYVNCIVGSLQYWRCQNSLINLWTRTFKWMSFIQQCTHLLHTSLPIKDCLYTICDFYPFYRFSTLIYNYDNSRLKVYVTTCMLSVFCCLFIVNFLNRKLILSFRSNLQILFCIIIRAFVLWIKVVKRLIKYWTVNMCIVMVMRILTGTCKTLCSLGL